MYNEVMNKNTKIKEIKEIADLQKLNIDKTWSLFLDRDGVINKRPMGDYVKNISEFEFLPGVVEAISEFSGIFGRIFVITNQRGIFTRVMTLEDLEMVHGFMLKEIQNNGGRIDKIYFCCHDRDENCGCRKPAPGMALKAKNDFPEVDFNKSIMVGDTSPDMQFGENAGMYTIKVTSEKTENENFYVRSLAELANIL